MITQKELNDIRDSVVRYGALTGLGAINIILLVMAGQLLDEIERLQLRSDKFEKELSEEIMNSAQRYDDSVQPLQQRRLELQLEIERLQKVAEYAVHRGQYTEHGKLCASVKTRIGVCDCGFNEARK